MLRACGVWAASRYGDPGAFAFSTGVVLVVVEGVKLVAKSLKKTGSTRKLLHVVTGPVFVLTWPLFSDEGKRWAALVPLGMTAKFAAVGLGLLRDDADVAVMSRTGDRREILRGPLLYGFVFVGTTLLAFKSLTAAAALSALCFGDAAAETVGVRFGRRLKLPWSPRKSVAGSLGFFLAASAGILAAVLAFPDWRRTAGLGPYVAPAVLSAVVGALVESLPMPDLDNLLVPAAVGFAFHILSSPPHY
mmetsp:Transcript_7428/g.22908  ORF Transcript_7428/g.22908 Transcript_7428/m.22908 type:complete len:247 (-) Transcript_7428:165-905(-)